MRALRRLVDMFDLAMTPPLLLLAFLAEDEFAGIFHALALIRFGTAERADLRGDLAYLALVDAGDGDFGRLGSRDRHARRDRVHDIVAVAERKLQVLARHRRLVADAVDLELLLEALGDPADQVRDLGAGHAPHRAGSLVLAMRLDMDGAAVNGERHFLGRGEFEFALGAFDGDRLTFQLRGDAGGDDDGLLADTRHGSIPFLYPRPSEDGAEDLAADVVLARGMVSHDALRRRHDRDAEPVADARHGVDGRIDPAPRLRDALDLADDRLVVEILQLDLELGAAVAVVRGRIAADVAFGLKHVENLLAKGGAGRRHLAALAHLRIADPGEHIAEGIVHCHDPCPPHQLDLTRPGIRPLLPSSRIAMRDIFNLR